MANQINVINNAYASVSYVNTTLTNYYTKTIIDSTFLNYYTKIYIDSISGNLYNNYYIKSVVDSNIQGIYYDLNTFFIILNRSIIDIIRRVKSLHSTTLKPALIQPF